MEAFKHATHTFYCKECGTWITRSKINRCTHEQGKDKKIQIETKRARSVKA